MTPPSLPTAPAPTPTAEKKNDYVPLEKSTHPYTYRGEGTAWYQSFLWYIGRVFFRLIAVLLFHVRVAGQRHIPQSGGALLVTNHQSFLDPWIIGIGLHRQLHYMARESLFIGGFAQWMIESVNGFPVKRGRADTTAVRTAIERVQQGKLVAIFPESTRTLDGTIGPVAAGVAIIVHRAKVPVIPVLVDGAFEAWPRGQTLPHPHNVRVVYGTPIPYEALQNQSADDMALTIRRAFVQLQTDYASPHATASTARMEKDLKIGKFRLSGAAEM